MNEFDIIHKISEVSGRITGLAVCAGAHSSRLEAALIDCAEMLDSIVEDTGVVVYIDGSAIDNVLKGRGKNV